MDGVMPGNVTSIFQGVGDLEAALERAWSRIAELESILDHYRGTCDTCGRENVLVEISEIDDYYGTSYICAFDKEGCDRIVAAGLQAERERRRDAAKRGWETRRKNASNPR